MIFYGENELENEIRNMDLSKTPGYDNISNKIVKSTAKEISKPLTHNIPDWSYPCKIEASNSHTDF